jgi:hypothetical protein
LAQFRSSSSHAHSLRSSGLPHPQHRIISLHSASSVPLHSAVFTSAAPYIFSGCSFAQPSGSAPRPQTSILHDLFFNYQLSIIHYQLLRRFALNQGSPTAALYFFPAVSRSQYFSSLRKLRSVPVLRWLFDCRNTATALLTKNSVKTPFFAAVLGGVSQTSTTILKSKK